MHLFAGIGGGLLADLILGHEPVCAVEIDPCCCAVLRERRDEGWFPDLHVHEGDVRLWDPSEWAGRVDCIAAGFPCQDLSCAGKRAGLGEGTRSGLYREILRVASIVRPRYLFLENVAAILASGLGIVLGDLAAGGYDARWTCLRASDCGAPHQRDRWWLLADSGCGNGEGARLEECGVSVPSWWLTEPDVGRVAHGVPARVDRLRGLGNAQVPTQAALAWVLLGGPVA
jgi:DNA (cytosine-5)-methyltransferase 1